MSGVAAPSHPAASSTYQQPSDAAEQNLLAAQLAGADQQSNPYGTVYAGETHNGAGESTY